MKSARLSNIELLRIVSMLMVLAVHFDGASLGLPRPEGLSATDAAWWWRTAVESLAIVGVNCFTLISGYFGIKASVKGLASFVLQCVFYSVVVYTVGALCGLTPFRTGEWWESWLAITHTDLWYVPAYLCLYLLSPFLNAAISSMTDRRLYAATAGLTVLNIYAGWWWECSFNPNGYTVMQLILMYAIGRSLSRWLTGRERSTRRELKALGAYAAFTAITALSAAYMPALKVYAYNSPAVMAASVALTVAAISLPFHSDSINYMARSAFAVYLIHKNKLIWMAVVKPAALAAWADGSRLGQMTLTMLAFMALSFITAMIADALRRTLCRPVVAYIEKISTFAIWEK